MLPPALASTSAPTAVSVEVAHALSGELVGRLTVEPRQDTLRVINAALEEETGVPIKYQRLLLEGRMLSHEGCLAEQGIESRPGASASLLLLVLAPPPEALGTMRLSWDDGRLMGYLLRARADAVKRDQDGLFPLYHAAEAGHSACARALLSARADVAHTSREGRSALWPAAAEGHTACAQVLLEARADIGHIDHSGRSVLHAAVSTWRRQQRDCVRLLLQARADPQRKDARGITPLDLLENLSACMHLGAPADSDVQMLQAAAAAAAAAAAQTAAAVALGRAELQAGPADALELRGVVSSRGVCLTAVS